MWSLVVGAAVATQIAVAEIVGKYEEYVGPFRLGLGKFWRSGNSGACECGGNEVATIQWHAANLKLAIADWQLPIGVERRLFLLRIEAKTPETPRSPRNLKLQVEVVATSYSWWFVCFRGSLRCGLPKATTK